MSHCFNLFPSEELTVKQIFFGFLDFNNQKVGLSVKTVYPPVKKFVLNPWSFVVKFWNHLQEHCWQEIKLCKDEILGEESKWDIIMSSKPRIQSNVGLEPTQKERVKWCEQSRWIKFLLALKVYGNVAVACRKFPLLIWELYSCHKTLTESVLAAVWIFIYKYIYIYQCKIYDSNTG